MGGVGGGDCQREKKMEKRMSGWLPKCSQVSWLSLIPAMLSCCVTLGKSLAFSDSYPKPKSTLQWSKRKCWSPKRKCWSEFLLLPVPAE